MKRSTPSPTDFPLYKLGPNGEPVQCSSVEEWSDAYRSADRKVAVTDLGGTRKLPNASVSTVFTGTDHRLPGEVRPILYETRVFGGPLDGEAERSSTRADALAIHERTVQRVRAALRAQS